MSCGSSACVVKDEGSAFAKLALGEVEMGEEVMHLYPGLVWMWICSLRSLLR